MANNLKPISLIIRTRKEYLASAPRIAEYPATAEKARCEQIKYGKLPMYAIFKDDSGVSEEKRRAVIEKHRCKNNAGYVFVDNKGVPIKLCMSHAFIVIDDERWGNHYRRERNHEKKSWFWNWYNRLSGEVSE
ncbi:hypothetical protein SEA_JUMBO_76 [Gordonia phage Jumbo]|uniref:Uncharacterized protein n=1 Tax=Gordonia phage Jumbo TaxID=1887650 RepID=A0A1B3B0Q8_9CAUD|nr:hypothetical protein BIZ69_gp076 [Gordonia phage Jumbo]AOE44584.1 hypothetical protein SEA_JUMBO_76 [Gordonia phage Jumbo]